MRTLAIIGGGYSGTMTAVNLARFSDSPMRIYIINANRPFGRGTAYSTSRTEHLLNVAARNMSAFPDHPDHFFEWLRSRSDFDTFDDKELQEMFVPRRIYGDYIRGIAANFLSPVMPGAEVHLIVIDDVAVDVTKLEGGNAAIKLQSGKTIEADSVLLATGHQPPAGFRSKSPISHDSRYCSDPWENWLDRLPAPGGTVVLLGTGLTMVDSVVTLSELDWKGKIIAISRNGMLPRSHFRGIHYPDYIPENVSELNLSQLVNLVKSHCEKLKQISQNSAIAIDKLRPYTQQLWKNLTLEEKKEFLKKHASNWNVTRHRIAPAIHERVTDQLDDGQLEIIRGNIEYLVPQEQGIEVHYTGSGGTEGVIQGDLVVNCTGPQLRYSTCDVPLTQNLLKRGLVQPDELDMGVTVDDDFRIMEPDGKASKILYAIGPLLRGSLWESIAVPELRGQAMRVAQVMLEQEPVETEEQYVLEYFI
ncbi:MAG: FAD/NAD(P)-binding protein [Planctomycetaceae bacterium]|nr:FAD/NAD(P)-binding protein [Planctomycetaceae bacterium]